MAWSPDPDALRGRVAVVAGATRGAGRGIAAALGEAGATVVCTGRSSAAGPHVRSDYDRAETIEETAELVHRARRDRDRGRRSTTSTPSRCGALAERVRADHGHIDVLVNDIWGAEVLKGGPAGVEHPDLGARPRRRPAHPAARRRHPPDHLASPAAAAGRPAGRAARRDDRRHRDLQRRPVPDLGLLRPGQGRGEPAGVLAGARARCSRGDGGRRHAGLAALGDDARQLRGHRGQLARRPRRHGGGLPAGARRVRALRVAPLRRPRRRRAGRGPRPGPVEPAVGHLRPSWPASTASPTSTARGPTAGPDSTDDTDAAASSSDRRGARSRRDQDVLRRRPRSPAARRGAAASTSTSRPSTGSSACSRGTDGLPKPRAGGGPVARTSARRCWSEACGGSLHPARPGVAH